MSDRTRTEVRRKFNEHRTKVGQKLDDGDITNKCRMATWWTSCCNSQQTSRYKSQCCNLRRTPRYNSWQMSCCKSQHCSLWRMLHCKLQRYNSQQMSHDRHHTTNRNIAKTIFYFYLFIFNIAPSFKSLRSVGLYMKKCVCVCVHERETCLGYITPPFALALPNSFILGSVG